MADIQKPKAPRPIPRSPKAGDVSQLLEYLERSVEAYIRLENPPPTAWRTIRNLASVSLMVDTGLRIGEVANLRLADIDLDSAKVFVRDSKTASQRELPVYDTTRGNLRLWLNERAKLNPGHLDYVFIANRGGIKRITIFTLREALYIACDRAGVERIRPHSLRHFFASSSLENGANLSYIGSMLGHAPGSAMTLRYAMAAGENRRAIHQQTGPLAMM